jgi:hypothetical protein
VCAAREPRTPNAMADDIDAVRAHGDGKAAD